jgi:hypothetical protein
MPENKIIVCPPEELSRVSMRYWGGEPHFADTITITDREGKEKKVVVTADLHAVQEAETFMTNRKEVGETIGEHGQLLAKTLYRTVNS